MKLSEIKDGILGEDGPSRKRTRFYLNEYEGHHLLGIREFYLDKKSGEFRHTRKGINLNRDTFMELQRVMSNHEDDIMNWLRIGYIPEEILRYQQLQEEARKKNFHIVGDVDIIEVNDFRSKNLFFDQHKGSKTIIELNTSHPFAKAITIDELSKSTPEEIQGLFARLLASYSKSRTMLLGTGVSEPRILFEQNEFDWSQFASQYVKEVKK